MSVKTNLSVVVACIEGIGTIDLCLSRLQASCDGLDSELLVVHDSDTRLAQHVRGTYPKVRVIDAGSEAVVPLMWATGYRASHGSVVAFSTGHCLVGESWARALLAAVNSGAVGAGGPIALAPKAGVVGRAVYFLRYSNVMRPVTEGRTVDLAGDNAAYSRTALRRHEHGFGEGFWEVEFHRRVIEEGGYLMMVPSAEALFGRSFRLSTILKHRFGHAVHFGIYRVRETSESRIRVVLAAPLVPVVLLARIAARVMKGSRNVADLLIALPALMPLLGAWAVGEAVGALRGDNGPAPFGGDE